MSITSRRSVEKVAATAGVLGRDGGDGRRVHLHAGWDAEHRVGRSVPTPSPRPSPCRRRRRTGRGPPVVAAGDERLDGRLGVVGVAPSRGSGGSSKPASRTAARPWSAAVEIRASGATAASRSSARRARPALGGSARPPPSPSRRCPGPTRPRPGDRVHHESDVHVRSFGGEEAGGVSPREDQDSAPQNKREPMILEAAPVEPLPIDATATAVLVASPRYLAVARDDIPVSLRPSVLSSPNRPAPTVSNPLGGALRPRRRPPAVIFTRTSPGSDPSQSRRTSPVAP